MEVYVDELPKLCCYCKFYYGNSQGAVCKLSGILTNHNETLGQMKRHCPLQYLADHDKQVRKKVCEEIRDLAGNYFELPICYNCGEASNDDVVLTGNDLTEILDQIQGENNGN